jgi:hypothetical protein
MKVPLKTLLESQAALNELTASKLPARAAFQIGAMVDKIAEALNRFEGERRKLAQSLGTVAEGSRTYTFTPEKRQQFDTEYDDLVSAPVDVGGDQIPVSMLGDAQLTPLTMARLSWLLVAE